jgi:hypothetical protein
MKLNLHNFLTLDGVMQAPGDADEDRTGGFGYGGWLVPFADQDMGMIVNGWFDKADAILLGPTTYEAIFHVVRPAALVAEHPRARQAGAGDRVDLSPSPPGLGPIHRAERDLGHSLSADQGGRHRSQRARAGVRPSAHRVAPAAPGGAARRPAAHALRPYLKWLAAFAAVEVILPWLLLSSAE